MKKYIFLLILFTQLSIVKAESYTHTWKGTTSSDDWSLVSNWDCGSNPTTVPDGNSIVKIPNAPTGNTYKYPKLTADVQAKGVTIEDKALLDLSTYLIKTSGLNAKIKNFGTLKLEGTNGQKAWFESSNQANKIVLENGSTVSYYGSSTDPIYAGTYKKLTLSRSISASGLTVEDITKIIQAITITSDNQSYLERVEAKDDVTFAANSNNSVIKFEKELIAKDSGNVFKNITITKGVLETKGIVEAKNINIGLACTKWTSSANVKVSENIEAPTTQWNATAGNISVFKDCNSPKLEQTQGLLIFNGNALQSVKLKKIKKLVVETGANVKIINTSAENIEIENIENKAGATLTSIAEPLVLTGELKNAGSVNISSLKLSPFGDAIKIEGSSVANHTSITHLLFEGAGGKTLQIKNKIEVLTELKLRGSSSTSLLKVEGEGTISVTSALVGEGEFLAIETNIPIENGTYKTKHSKPEGNESDINAGKPQNWIFNQSLLVPVSWKGGLASFENDWTKDENWVPRCEVDEEVDVIIPSGKTHYPILTVDVKAKSVDIKADAIVDLATFLIKTASSKLSKISNSGTLKLEGAASQKAWFESSNQANKIVLENGSTVFYYGSSTDSVYVGPYKNLKLSRNISTTALTVENTTKITQAITITSDNQNYLGRVEIEDDTTFATNSNNSVIKFEKELIAKDSGNVFKNITITKGVLETKGKVEAKNINTGATCSKWTSTANITAEESIVLDDSTVWKANSGDITFKKDLTASKLEQIAGKVVANGNGNQSIKINKINEFEVVQTSVSSLVSLSPTAQTLGKVINSGNLTIPVNTDLTVTELNNQANAIFTSNSEIKLTKWLINAGSLTISKLLPNGNAIKIEGNSVANNTTFTDLFFENASGKSLEIKNNVSVLGHLKLSGMDATHVLEIKGPGEIHLPSSFNDKGKFLHIHTNIPLMGAKCTTEKSKPIGSDSDIVAGKPENWIFDDPTSPLTWEGSVDTSWVNRENWRPKGLPFEETETVIPANKTNYPVLVSSDNPKAKVITIEAGAIVDLATFLIKTASSKLSKISNRGTLKLEGNASQKAWFEASNQANKIVLENGSTVFYYGSSTDPIYAGSYKNLKLSRNISANALTVENTTKITQAITITSDNQNYLGRVEIEDNTTFATNHNNSMVKFEKEVIAKDSGNVFKNITITKGVLETKGKVEAKNINTGATCSKWTSTANITAEESIVLDDSTVWKANSGDITFKKDLTASKLEQIAGKVIANGNSTQNLIAKTLNRLEMQNTSSSDKIKIQLETVAEFILQTGNASLLKDITITKEFANNGGVFDALENKKLVTLAPIDTLTIKGKLSVSGNPNPPIAETGTKFFKLHCRNAGGKTLHFTNAIEVLCDISTEISDYVPPSAPNFTQDNISLVLEGNSASSKLNIKGDGQIWFNSTPPFPKPKKGGKFLHVASGVQIRGGCYRVMNSTRDKPSPRNWIFEEYAQIVSTLAINGRNEVCITFTRPVAKPLPDSLKIISPTFPDMTSISVESYPKGSNKANSDRWFFQFGQNFTPEMLLEKESVISLGESSLDFIFEGEGSDFYPFKKGYISDIGLNLVNPVLAKNTKEIQTFDGSKTLPFINTSLFVDVPSVLDGRTLKLYADSVASSSGQYWVPNKAVIPWKNDFKNSQNENAGAATFSIDAGKSTPDTKMFILPTSSPRLKINATLEFMLSYDNLPCARLKDPNDIFSFDLWRFDFIGTRLQRGGVTVLNNVINVSKDQSVGIEITTNSSGTLTVQIMTLDGSIVKTFVNDYKPQGNYSYYWNGRNEAGRVVARGMYFVRVSGKGIDEVRKVLVTHD